MFDENRLEDEEKNEDQHESSDGNSSEEFNQVLDQPIAKLELSTAGKEDMNFDEGRFNLLDFYR
jgi:hypothetical protein